jgi:hypothetical protein
VKRGVSAALLALGVAQMTGDVTGCFPLRAIAAATAASPAPRVFTRVGTQEPFSARFVLEWTDPAGRARSLTLTPETYARVRGPYNRRNVYGAAVAGGPVLANDPVLGPLFRTVARQALCGEAPLLAELAPGQGPYEALRVRLEPARSATPAPPALEVSCG